MSVQENIGIPQKETIKTLFGASPVVAYAIIPLPLTPGYMSCQGHKIPFCVSGSVVVGIAAPIVQSEYPPALPVLKLK